MAALACGCSWWAVDGGWWMVDFCLLEDERRGGVGNLHRLASSCFIKNLIFIITHAGPIQGQVVACEGENIYR